MTPPLETLTSIPTVSGLTDTSNFKPYPTSSEENGPVLDAEKDASLFGNWESLSREADVQATPKR